MKQQSGGWAGGERCLLFISVSLSAQGEHYLLNHHIKNIQDIGSFKKAYIVTNPIMI